MSTWSSFLWVNISIEVEAVLNGSFCNSNSFGFLLMVQAVKVSLTETTTEQILLR